MSKEVIPLPTDRVNFKFALELAGTRLNFHVKWLNGLGYFAADIRREGESFARGRAMHPGINLLQGLDGFRDVWLGISESASEPRPETLGRGKVQMVLDRG